ncbi:tudor domain-containing protein 7 [Xenopus laevis]|nr:tudor domain-containing protein 7 [Xenopus laevis]
MMESEKELVAKMLRAVLQANKNGVPLHKLQAEYKSVTGEPIPFKDMGFPALDAYLKSIPSVVRIEVSRVGEVTCYAVACKETARIAELVAHQRSSKKKGGHQVNCQMRLKSTAPVSHFGKPKITLRQPGFTPPQEMMIRKPVPTPPWGKGNYFGPRTFEYSPQPIPQLFGVAPMQRHLPNMNRPERKVTLPPRFQREVKSPLLPTPITDSNANHTQSYKRVVIGSGQSDLPVIQNNLKELLNKHSNGLWLSKLPQLYKETYKQDLGGEVLKQVPSWTHICTVQKLVSSGHTEIVIYATTRKQQPSTKNIQNRSNDQAKPNVPVVLSTPSSPPPLQISGSIPKDELKEKISTILTKYSNGLWYHALPKVFEDMFKQKLPIEAFNLDSLTDICTVDLISEEPFKAILYGKSAERAVQNSNPSVNNNIPQKLHDREPPLCSEEPDMTMAPPPLVIPSEASPSVLVVELNSTNDVVIRYIGRDYSAAQERMEDELKDFCSKSSTAQVRPLRVGQLVAAKAEEDAWLRAQISAIEDKKIKVCYVDYGFSETVDITKVCKLGKPFYTLPFQATKCRLAGLEAFCDDSVIIKALEAKACGKILAVEILHKSEKPLVVLYDTSGDDDININAACLKELYDRSLSLQLKANLSFSNVTVTNVCSDGTLFCQVPSKGLAKLYETLQKVDGEFQFQQVTSHLYVSLPFCGKICLYHYKGKWARVEITNVHSSRALDVHFLDSGTIASVKVSELKEIPPPLLRDLISIPPQALKCCLADLPLNIGMWTPDAVLWLRNTVLNCPECSIKVVKIDEAMNMVHIYLFTSNNFPDLERSINRRITNEELLKQKQKDVFLNMSVSSLEKGRGGGGAPASQLFPSGPCISPTSVAKKPDMQQSSPVPSFNMPPALPLPRPGEHMDVFVSVACHPGHFVCQPWQELHKLELVMDEMRLHYSTTEEKPIALEKNKLYAAKIENNWYRVLVKGILTNGLVSVYELDHGRHELVSCRKVQPLIEKFMHLPFQAITSQLAGINCEQWSEETSIVFRNHVEKKPLVALVQTIHESTHPWERRVVAYIVDTTLPDTDIWIHELMTEYLAQFSKPE